MCRQAGFQLIELLITLTIISLLLVVGSISYVDDMVKAKRLAAAGWLGKLAIAVEEYHLLHNRYQGASWVNLRFPEYVLDRQYQLVMQMREHDYVLMAKPLGKQAERDTVCGTLVLYANGEKGVLGGGGKVEASCW
jgi:type IV pilus assembly protein PilE